MLDENNQSEQPGRNKKETSYKRAEFMRTLSKLRREEESIEKSLDAYIDNMRLEPKMKQGIVREKLRLSAERQKTFANLERSTRDIVSDLEAVKSVVNDSRDARMIDIPKYKEKLEKLSQKIQNFRIAWPLQPLEEEQNKLESELSEFSSILYKKNNGSGAKLSISGEKSRITREEKSLQDYETSKDFSSLVARTGHTQNWSEEDHLLFLKIRKRSKSVPALVHAIQEKCPDLSTERIVNHEAWYKLYLELREKQKVAVKEWRKKKESGKGVRRDKEAEGSGAKTIETIKAASKLTSKNATSNFAEGKTAAGIKSVATDDPITADKKDRIKKWREEKENKRVMDEEQLKQLKSKRALEERRKRQARMKKVKASLNEYKEQKSAETVASNPQNIPKEMSKPESAWMIKMFRRQDEEFTKKRLSVIENAREKGRSQSARNERRDPLRRSISSTLFDSTKAWEERCKGEEIAGKTPAEVLYIKNIPKQSIHWRNRETIT